MNRTISAIIPAAGAGKRFSDKFKKQYFLINGKPVIYYTLKNLNESYGFDEILIGYGQDDLDLLKEVVESLNIKNCEFVKGGKERFDTVYNCFLKSTSEYILIHDAVRPFINREIVNECISNAFRYQAAICGVKPRDTVKLVNGFEVDKTIDREKVFLVHTPQVFKKEILREAFDYQRRNNIFVTDEASMVEMLGHKVYISLSSFSNVKLTEYDDIKYFEYLINR
ncbi:MAG: 2-C-methyl-D-erythritol 4-phosphate cytidylyltransferase [Deferribacteres bacterium]|jgi:2-C-methyl-D-erythritol 4-phosphate cytidylyltransferase|nr:2-C-methyl-D-erythritol 4-phosphate cytidylyltransferase [Deferribacteraceae bacterium]MDK2791859.1 2-C-methyl-D-erythritol 4-phosphate cytidylyltransferase [Deferribacteres bacterium]